MTLLVRDVHSHVKPNKNTRFKNTIYDKSGKLCIIKKIYKAYRYSDMVEYYELTDGRLVTLSYRIHIPERKY